MSEADATRRPGECVRRGLFTCIALAVLSASAPVNPARMLVMVLVAVEASAVTAAGADADSKERAVAGLRARAEELGLDAAQVDDVRVLSQHTSAHTGVTHLYVQEQIAGIPVAGAVSGLHFDSRQKEVALTNRFVRRQARGAAPTTPRLAAEEAIERAAAHLGLAGWEAAVPFEAPSGDSQRATYFVPGAPRSLIPVELSFYSRGSKPLRLAWQLEAGRGLDTDWGHVWIDAETGELLGRSSWVAFDSYEVFALPKENPDSGPRSIEVDPADLAASPFGWHDSNTPPVFSGSAGNNVLVGADPSGDFYLDRWLSYVPGLDFLFPLDLAIQEPADYQDASITNLFYLVNMLHDLLYHYGFDEAAGNFQKVNYTGKGVDGDFVWAVAQEGLYRNVAYFNTAPETSPDPRSYLSAGLARPAVGTLTIHAPAAIAGSHELGGFAYDLASAGSPVTGSVKLADDGVGVRTDGCEKFPADYFRGSLALIDQVGDCPDRTLRAQAAGATAVIFVRRGRSAPGGFTVGSQIAPSIPAFSVSADVGESIKDHLPVVEVTVAASQPGDAPDRDFAFDAGIIAHEYAHGLSTRLTGGPATSDCLSNAEQMGEGWSDFLGIWLTAVAEDQRSDPREFAAYLRFSAAGGPGFGNFPYTTDMTLNPQTYADVASTNVPHGVGEIWASMLWEMYWELVDVHGFDPDLRTGSGGNNLALQLVVDGLKLQPCDPSFVEGRDAILQADVLLTGGENQCNLWRGFAKRGLGVSADAGDGDVLGDESEAFDVPSECAAPPPLCQEAPAKGCLQARTASLSVLEKKPGAETLTARLAGFDAATDPADFGDPVAGDTGYALCVYDDASALAAALLVERAGQSCGPKSKPCWKEKAQKGWSYADPGASAFGVRSVSLVGGRAGQGSARVEAGNRATRGQTQLPTGLVPALSASSEVTVQLVTSDAACIEASLTPGKEGRKPGKFTAKAGSR